MDSSFVNIAVYATVNLLLFFSWYAILFKKKYYLSFVDRLIGAFILGLTQIIFTEMLLGAVFKKLSAYPLFWINISVSSVMLALALVPRRQKPSHENNEIFSNGLIKKILFEFKDRTAWFFRIIREDMIFFWIFSLFFISVCWIVLLGYLFPSYTWDALWYHLPMVGYIMQSGAIQEVPAYSFITQVINGLPKNIELFSLWNIIFLKNDAIVDLTQLFFTVMGVFTIYSIAVKLKIKEKHAVYSSLLFFFSPVIILQSTTNYIDIAVSVLFLAAINFLMCDNTDECPDNKTGIISFERGKIPVLLAGLTSGILLGSKWSGPLFVTVLAALIVMIGVAVRFNLFNIMPPGYKGSFVKDRFIPYIICFIIPVFAMGGYWYIKNWVLYGNPFHPMEITFFNFTLFEDLYRAVETMEGKNPTPEIIKHLSLLSGLFHVWMEKVRYYTYDSKLSGFGPVWFILFLPSIVFSIAYAARKKKYNFLLISMVLVVTFIIAPRNWNTRYVIFMIGLGALSFGLALDYFEKRQLAIKIIALSLVMYVFLTSHSPYIMPGKIAEFIKLPAKDRILARHAPFNIDVHVQQDYGLWTWISNNIKKGNVLTYAFEPLFLSPLWNRSFSNKVVYVKSENFRKWIKNLLDNEATHVLIKQGSIEDKWIRGIKKDVYDNPLTAGVSEHFKAVYSDDNYKVLLFQPDSKRFSY